jgi:hypothetical protein|tara:strand:+ start:230 stop:763 length:534 start_codon:yes stop_codon:yes gene_type:complete
MHFFFKKFFYILLLLSFITLVSCGDAFKRKKTDAPVNSMERAKRNIKEGRGASIGGLLNRSTTYQFSSSNPMWRSTLEILDFIPLTTVDYSGGVIISDWYSDSSTRNDQIKVTVQFLSNEIKSNSLKIIVHKKSCDNKGICVTKKIKSKIEEELQRAILVNAAKMKTADKNKKLKKK